jgi:hypothetical protein
MPQQIEVNGKPAIRIKATKIRETEKAMFLNCEGDELWFPKGFIKFNEPESYVDIQEWLYNQKFEDE